MEESKLLAMAGVISNHILDGKPEEARAFLRKHPRSIKAIQVYYHALKEYDPTNQDAAFWRQHAGIAYEIVTGVKDESKKQKPAIISNPRDETPEQFVARFGADHPHGGTSAYQRGPCLFAPNEGVIGSPSQKPKNG